MTACTRHFLDLDAIEATELRGMLDLAASMKAGAHDKVRPLAGKFLAMVFEKPSTRTRVSFEVAMKQLGGDVVVLNVSDLQLGRGETVADTARVLSRYVDCIMMRTFSKETIVELAEHASVPVINGLTDHSHPCQLMADILAYEEHRGPIRGKTIAWSGDGNNMAASWIHAAVKFSFSLRIACPKSRAPSPCLLDWARAQGGSVTLTDDPAAAVDGADCVVTDAWISMGEEDTDRHNLLVPFRVDDALLSKARDDAIFLHCLPAHRGEEVTAEVIDGPRSVVWDEAENRLHTQKAILSWCLS